MRLFRFLAAVTLAAAWSVSPDASAGQSVSLGKPTFDPAPLSVPVAGSPVKFTAKARKNGADEEGEAPWVGVHIDFGDKKPHADSGAIDGAGIQTYTTTHVFDEAGDYVVKVTAYHGFKGTGYKYASTKLLKITVACVGTDLGPKTCPKPDYASWTGQWKVTKIFGGESAPSLNAGEISLTFEQLGDDVLGTMRIDRGNNKITNVRFHATEALIAKGAKSSLQIKGKHDAVDSDKTTKHTFSMVIKTDADGLNSYRTGGATFDNINLVGEGVAKFTNFVFEPVSKPSPANEATVCTILGAGQKKAKVGHPVTFAVQAVNVGPAGLPAGRLGLQIHIDGATPDPDFVNGTGFSVGSVSGHDIVLVSDALGDGKGRSRQRMVVLVAARVDPAAVGTVVKCTATVTDVGAATDTLVHVTLPPPRLVCIPVAE